MKHIRHLLDTFNTTPLGNWANRDAGKAWHIKSLARRYQIPIHLATVLAELSGLGGPADER